jgi:hypothetical protein
VFTFVLSATSHSFQTPKPGLLHRVASSRNLSMNNGTFILGRGGCDPGAALALPSINSRQFYVALQSDTFYPTSQAIELLYEIHGAAADRDLLSLSAKTRISQLRSQQIDHLL